MASTCNQCGAAGTVIASFSSCRCVVCGAFGTTAHGLRGDAHHSVPEASNCAAVVEPEDSSEDGPTCVIGRGGRTFVLVQQCTLVVLLSALILCMATYYIKKTPSKPPPGVNGSTVASTGTTDATSEFTAAQIARQAAPELPLSDYWAQPSLYQWTPTCETAACERQSKWLVSMISKQVNPCWETNAFVCDRTPLSRGWNLGLMQVRDGGTAVGNETVRISRHSKDLDLGASRTVPHWYNIPKTAQELQRACDAYAASREESMDSVRMFMAQFNLDLASMQDDGNEDPLDRVLEVSLLFGLGALVQMRRRYDLISDPAKPFKLEVAVVDADQELFSIWNNVSAPKWKSYYTSCLGSYGPEPGTSEHTQLVADLMAADKEASELYRSAYEPTDMNQSSFSSWTFEEVANASKVSVGETVTSYNNHSAAAAFEFINAVSETWLTRIRKHARAEYDASDGLITRNADLLVAGFVLRPDKRFAMRKLIAWHLLRTIIGPKHQCLDPYASAVAESYKKVPGINTMCSGLTAFIDTIHGRAISLLIGLNSVPTEWLPKIMQLMARIQRAMALTVLGKGEVRTTDDDTSFASASFLQAGHGSNTAPVLDRLFARVKDLPKGFVFHWLGMLLAWHGLPPLLQAHMQAMSATVAITWNVIAYMRPPYYYADGLASYNYAVLGQLIAHAVANQFTSASEDKKARWEYYWKRWNALDYNSVYCVYAKEQNLHERQPHIQVSENPDGEFGLEDNILQTRTTRLAHLAFKRLPFAEQKVLPAIRLSPMELFQAAYCAYSCMRRTLEYHVVYPVGLNCMVIFLHSRGMLDTTCDVVEEPPNQYCFYI